MRLATLLSLASGLAAVAVLAQLSASLAPGGDAAPGPAASPAPGSSPSTAPGATRAAAGSDAPESAGSRFLYRWRDPAGRVHVTSQAPTGGSAAVERIPFNPDPRRPAGAVVAGGPAGGAPAASRGDPAGAPLSVYTPEGWEALLRQVEDVGGRLDDRRRLLEDLDDHL
jgi:hypothetical protein